MNFKTTNKMKQGTEDFKIIKENPKGKNRNYIFQNNRITRIGFYIVATLLIVGVLMVITTGFFLL